MDENSARRAARTPRVIAAWAVALAAAALTVVAMALHARNAGLGGARVGLYLADVWVGLVLPPVGAWLVSHGEHRSIAAILLSLALLPLGTAAGEYAVYATATGSAGSTGAAGVAAWLATWSWAPYLLVPSVAPLLVPTGRPANRFWRAVVVGLLVGTGAAAVLAAVRPGPLEAFPEVDNPLGLVGWAGPVGGALIAVTMLGGLAMALAGVVWRWRWGPRDDRARLAWFVPAVAFTALTQLTADGLPYPWNDAWPALGFTVLVGTMIATEYAYRVTDGLRRSRQAIVAAREAERLRLRHDLHDGIGPQMAGLALQISTIAGQTADPAIRDSLTSVQHQLRHAVREVRHIVADLRPAALDELGLPDAVRAAASLAAGGTTAVGVRTPASLPALPPEVEVAALRIASEAITNAVRHARASVVDCVLTLAGGELRIEVADDGPGDRAWSSSGVGLTSMRQRAEEVGGRLEISTTPGRGTIVAAHLPVGRGQTPARAEVRL